MFQTYQDAAFFQACESCVEGQKFLSDYHEFVGRYGQRGMPDRDIFFPRRCEDPGIDYRALASMLSHPDAQDPEEKERETNRVREAFVSITFAAYHCALPDKY